MERGEQPSSNSRPSRALELIPAAIFCLGLVVVHDANNHEREKSVDGSYAESQHFKDYESDAGYFLETIGAVGILINGLKNYYELRRTGTNSTYKS